MADLSIITISATQVVGEQIKDSDAKLLAPLPDNPFQKLDYAMQMADRLTASLDQKSGGTCAAVVTGVMSLPKSTTPNGVTFSNMAAVMEALANQ